MKKIRYILIWVMVLLMTTFPVSAAANKRMIQECITNGSKIQLYTYVEEGDKAEYSANLSGINLPSPKVKSTEKNAVTWYVLLDVSGSMKGTPFDCAKVIIQTVADNMSDKDNMVIATMGDTILPSPFMSDQAEITSYLEGLQVTKEDTNLYTGIVKSMEELASNTSVKTKKCLIILSDGHNDQKKGSTEKEATSIVKDQAIPVFTVATLYDNPSKEANEYADILGSFARDSLGGKHYVPVVENISASDVGTSIVENVHKVQKVTFDLSDLSNEDLVKLDQKNEDIMTLRLSCLVNGEKSYEDTVDIFKDTLEIKVDEAETEVEETEKESEEKAEKITEKPEKEAEETTIPVEKNEIVSEKKNEGEKGIPVISIVVCTGIAIAILVFIYVIWSIKKKRKKINNDSGGGENPEKKDDNILVHKNKKLNDTEKIIPPAYRLQIAVIGDSNMKFQYLFDANKTFTMGRDDRADMKLIQNDMKLSGRSCLMDYDGTEMYITDISTNGIALEGVKLIKNVPTKIANNSKVRMGSYEYRLSWTRNE